MEQYKLINAQLISQVQSQRLRINELMETEVLLKRELMKAHEKYLFDSQYNKNKLKVSIKNLLESLDLNADFNIHFPNTRPSQSQSQASENCPSKKSSSRLCAEFKRSTILLEKTVPISPIRNRRSTNTRVETESPSIQIPVEIIKTKTPEPRHLVELQSNLSPSSPIIDQPEDQTVLLSPMIEGGLISIIEESESDDNTFPSSGEIDESEDIIVSDTREELTLPLPLRDVTNQADGVSPRTRKPRSSPPCSKQSTKKTISRDKSVANRKNDESNCDNLETSIEFVRHVPYHKSPIQMTISHTSEHVNNLTPHRNKLSFNTFNQNVYQNGGCSTPLLEQQASSSTKSTIYVQDSGEQLNSDLTLSGRPSRSCRPKLLKEPNIKHKLRNGTSAKL